MAKTKDDGLKVHTDYVLKEDDDDTYQIVDARSRLIINAGLSIAELVERQEELNSINGATLTFRSQYELEWLAAEDAERQAT